MSPEEAVLYKTTFYHGETVVKKEETSSNLRDKSLEQQAADMNIPLDVPPDSESARELQELNLASITELGRVLYNKSLYLMLENPEERNNYQLRKNMAVFLSTLNGYAVLGPDGSLEVYKGNTELSAEEALKQAYSNGRPRQGKKVMKIRFNKINCDMYFLDDFLKSQ